MEEKPRVLVSMCLLGAACRYDGHGIRCEGLEPLMDRCALIPVCPEQLGGLPTPRVPAERRGERVVAQDGRDVTGAFARGAAEAASLAERFHVRHALLKERSPSCGVHEIYDGSFSGARVPGRGVTAESLSAMGVRLYSESEWNRLLEELECEER